MKQLRAGVLVLAVTLSLGACSTLKEGLMDPGVTTQRAGTGTRAAGSTTATTAAPTATPTPTAPDQSTPEDAMESWLRAMVAGDGEAVCALMAADGQPVASLEGATASCAEAVDPLLSSLEELDEMFKGLSISGATVVDDLATFEAATTRPALAAQVIHRFEAVRIKNKWYVTE
jgi:hypothetical protein